MNTSQRRQVARIQPGRFGAGRSSQSDGSMCVEHRGGMSGSLAIVVGCFQRFWSSASKAALVIIASLSVFSGSRPRSGRKRTALMVPYGIGATAIAPRTAWELRLTRRNSYCALRAPFRSPKTRYLEIPQRSPPRCTRFSSPAASSRCVAS